MSVKIIYTPVATPITLTFERGPLNFTPYWGGGVVHDNASTSGAARGGCWTRPRRRNSEVAERSLVARTQRMSTTTDEVAGLRRTVESQAAALAHWRRGADLDAARLKRQDEALFRIAHGHDGLETVRAIAASALCAETM